MAAFSHQQSHLVLGSAFVPKTSNMMSALLEEDTFNTTTCFAPICPHEHPPTIPVHVQIHESTTTEVPFTSTDPFLTVKQNKDSSSMAVEFGTGDRGTKVATQMEKKRRKTESKVVAREGKGRKGKMSEEKKLKDDKKAKRKAPEEVPTGYIHVRARRGQATDSHSLAERVRREKISKRMRLLQSLVPGCDKIIGKAQILDEIINYVQSLQSQIEFLVSKLASASPMFSDFEVELDTNILASEKMCGLEPPSPSMLQSSSAKLRFLAETIPTSTSLLPQEKQRSNIISQDNGLPLWDMDDERQALVNHYGFNYSCPF
ncbi:hypothetical protein L1049_007142 [Liquidambar formosana]|uniref:BHLH domain-containing protein n=1 Tax=Liquidambar formosana TaxID=63359 RepID=A0AAP0WRX4_LIQFO